MKFISCLVLALQAYVSLGNSIFQVQTENGNVIDIAEYILLEYEEEALKSCDVRQPDCLGDDSSEWRVSLSKVLGGSLVINTEDDLVQFSATSSSFTSIYYLPECTELSCDASCSLESQCTTNVNLEATNPNVAEDYADNLYVFFFINPEQEGEEIERELVLNLDKGIQEPLTLNVRVRAPRFTPSTGRGGGGPVDPLVLFIFLGIIGALVVMFVVYKVYEHSQAKSAEKLLGAQEENWMKSVDNVESQQLVQQPYGNTFVKGVSI